MSQSGRLVTASDIGAVETLTGNTGGAVPPTGGNINVVGDGTTITVAGDPGTSTLTISTVAGGGTTYVGDIGSTTPVGGFLYFSTQALPAGQTMEFRITTPGEIDLRTSDGLFNTIIGGDANNSRPNNATENTGFGYSSLSNIYDSTNNSAFGYNSLYTIDVGYNNSGDGSFNAGFGDSTLLNLFEGAYNTAIGSSAGSNYTTNESSNICINNTGTVGESNVLRIGSATGTGNQQLAAAYICGINGVDVGSVASVVSINGDQLGSTTITAGANVTITPGANTITIAAGSGSGAITFDSDSGTATTSGNTITMHGTGDITTTATGSTVTFVGSGVTTVDTGSGTATASSNTITISGGSGVSTSATGSTITISASGAGFTWHDVTGGSATLAAENGYISDSGSLTTFTMPTNNAIGDTIKIVGKGAGGWKIVYGALQNIIMGSSASTATTGNIASTNANDCVELVCTTASITAPIFTVVSSIGNISIT